MSKNAVLKSPVTTTYIRFKTLSARLETNSLTFDEKRWLDSWINGTNSLVKTSKGAARLLYVLSDIPTEYLDQFYELVVELFKPFIDPPNGAAPYVATYCALPALYPLAKNEGNFSLAMSIVEIQRASRFPYSDRFIGFSPKELYNETKRENRVRNYLLELQDIDLVSLKRNRRSRELLPDPSRSSDSEVNRLGSQFRARMGNDLLSQIEEWIKDNGLTKKEAAEYAFKLAMSVPYPSDEPS